MIDKVKSVIKNYLENACLATYLSGLVTADGVQVSDRMIIPLEMVVGNAKAAMAEGSRVRLLRKHGGREYYILEVIYDIGE